MSGTTTQNGQPQPLPRGVHEIVGALNRASPQAELADIQRRKEAATKPAEERLQQTMQADQAQYDKTAAKLGESRDALGSPPPQQPQANPLQGWASAAAVFGMIASAFTRTPAISAMNAAATAINARNQGDWEAYKTAYQKWKDQTDLAIRRNQMMSEDMRNVMAKMQTDVAVGSAMLKSVAAKYGDERLAVLDEAGLGFQAAQIQAARDNSAMRMRLTLDEFEERVRHDRATEEGKGQKWELLSDDGNKNAEGHPTQYRYNPQTGQATTLDGQPYTPKSAAKIASSTTPEAGLSDAASDRIADQVIAGDKSALTGLGYGNSGAANRAKVQEAITKKLKEQGLTGSDLAVRTAEYMGTTAGERALGTRTATLGMAANEAAGFAPQVLATSDAIDRTKYPRFNDLQNALDRGVGGEDIVRFIDATNAFKNAYAQVVTRGGQSTDDARKRADEVISTAWTKGQVQAGIQQLMTEINIAKNAPNATREELSRMFSHAQGGEGAAALPAAAASHLTEGHITTFANGQKWTMQNGQPVRVQ